MRQLLADDYRSPIPKKLRWRSWAKDPEGITGDELLDFVNNDLFKALKNLSAGGQNAELAGVVRAVFEDAYNYMKSGQLMRQVINKINSIDFNNLTERQHFGDIYEQILNDLQSAGNAGEYYSPRAVTAFMADRIDPHPGEILFDPACGTGGFLTCAIRDIRERYVKKPADEQKMQQGLRACEKKQLPHMGPTGDLFASAGALGRRHGLPVTVAAHAGSGIVWACYLLGPTAPPDVALAGTLEGLRREAEGAEGSLDRQDAPASLKARVDAWGKPRDGFDVMKRLKAEFDPRGLCNPGRFLGGL